MENWKSIKDSVVKRFVNESKDKILYVIPSGVVGEYLVIEEDPTTGEHVEFLTKNQTEKRYGVKL